MVETSRNKDNSRSIGSITNENDGIYEKVRVIIDKNRIGRNPTRE